VKGLSSGGALFHCWCGNIRGDQNISTPFLFNKAETFSELGFQQTQRANAVFCTDIKSTTEDFGARRTQMRLNKDEV
jgi:hypothetical protein